MILVDKDTSTNFIIPSQTKYGLGFDHLSLHRGCRSFQTVFWIITLFISLLFVSACQTSSHHWLSIAGETMGTYYKVKTYVPKNVSAQQLQTQIDDKLKTLNQHLSTYIPTSEISRFNSSLTTSPIEISSIMSLVTQESLRISQWTDGSFDPTVAPLVELWGFGTKKNKMSPPINKDIQTMHSYTGWSQLTFLKNPVRLQKKTPRVTLDYSAIAKGYGVDVLAKLLLHHSPHFYIEIGGEIRVQGFRDAQREAWRIGIELPSGLSGDIQSVVQLTNLSMATSGDYRNYFEHEGHRYSHTMDPQTGYPVKHLTSSVTVLSTECMEADALATALLVMGHEKGLIWAHQNNIAALFLVRQMGTFKPFATKRYLDFQKKVR